MNDRRARGTRHLWKVQVATGLAPSPAPSPPRAFARFSTTGNQRAARPTVFLWALCRFFCEPFLPILSYFAGFSFFCLFS